MELGAEPEFIRLIPKAANWSVAIVPHGVPRSNAFPAKPPNMLLLH
jgi:hypothetical protein